jgi:hypothetical protein
MFTNKSSKNDRVTEQILFCQNQIENLNISSAFVSEKINTNYNKIYLEKTIE